MRTNQHGLGHLALLLIVVVLAAVGFAGWKVFNKDDKTADTAAVTNFKECEDAIYGIARDTMYRPTCTYNSTTYNNPTPSAPKEEVEDRSDYMTVKEWGIKIPLSNNLGLSYELKDTWGEFTSKKLTSIPGCQNAYVLVARGLADAVVPNHLDNGKGSTFKETYDASASHQTNSRGVKAKVGKYYYLHPGVGTATCGEQESDYSMSEASKVEIVKAINKMVTAE